MSQTSNGTTLVVLCPYCRRRHRHRWQAWQEDPGTRMSHCAGQRRRPYLIGTLPPEHLVQAVIDLRRAGNLLHRTAWTQDLRPDDVTIIGRTARAFADAVRRATERTR